MWETDVIIFILHIGELETDVNEWLVEKNALFFCVV